MTAPWKSPEHRLRRKKFNEELAVVGKMCRLHPKGKCMPATIGEIAKEAQGQSFSNDYFQSMSRPCVYMFLKDNHPLYIGSSIQGLWRFGVPTHHRAAIRNECDETYVLWLDGKTEEQVRQIEALMIAEFKPYYNKRKFRGVEEAPIPATFSLPASPNGLDEQQPISHMSVQ